MSFLDTLSAFLPFAKKEEQSEYFFAVNIGIEQITAALWVIKGKELSIINLASQDYPSLEDIVEVTDQLLDKVLGLKEIEPQKILFGVPNSWLSDDNLKDEYLKVLRKLVKELELIPMAYVATSNALIHFLEKQEGIPITAILVGFENHNLSIIVARAGKLDGVKVITRKDSLGADIEKALLTFTEVETLPSKILIYGPEAEESKSQLLSFPWMSRLSFLHLPKIEVLDKEITIKSICVAGGSEINENIAYIDQPTESSIEKKNTLDKVGHEAKPVKENVQGDLGFIVGDVAKDNELTEQHPDEGKDLEEINEAGEAELVAQKNNSLEIEDFEQERTTDVETTLVSKIATQQEHKRRLGIRGILPKSYTLLFGIIGILGVVALVSALLFLIKIDVKVYVEPKVLEKDAEVIADPNQKTVNEESKIIPGQIVEAEVSGSAKDTASGKKLIGDPAKGTIILYNKTSEPRSLSKGVQVSGSGGIKFTLDTSVTIASQSASDSGITFGKVNAPVTAVAIGADGNLPSGSDLTVVGYSADKLAAKTEGNFSGGTSKDVTVVSSEDQQRLLASLASNLRQQAQQKLQEQYPSKKILKEALSENITKKNYSKNINDQTTDFSLNMTIKYKGTAFDDADLRTIVSKLVNTQVPNGFQLDIAETETQADVSELRKDGKLVFLARFKAKLLPNLDKDKIKNQIMFKTPGQAISILKGMENVLGSEIKLTPKLPKILEGLPILSKNLTVEVKLK